MLELFISKKINKNLSFSKILKINLTKWKILGLIPSRLGSTRLTKKALLDIDGLPMVVHTAKRAQLSKKLTRVIVCTDSNLIGKECDKHNIEWFITSKRHINGTERIVRLRIKLNQI